MRKALRFAYFQTFHDNFANVTANDSLRIPKLPKLKCNVYVDCGVRSGQNFHYLSPVKTLEQTFQNISF